MLAALSIVFYRWSCSGELLSRLNLRAFYQRCEMHPTSDSKWKIGTGGILHDEVLVFGALHAPLAIKALIMVVI